MFDTTLHDDFSVWWNMKKYHNREIPAQKYSDVLITERHGSNNGWPGPQKDVKYWVRLENGVCVGFRHEMNENGRPVRYAEFPIVEMK